MAHDEHVTLEAATGQTTGVISGSSDADTYLSEVSWGDLTVETALAEGTDIVGAVAGTRQRVTREVVLGIDVSNTDPQDFADSTVSLDAVIAAIQAAGGTLTRQVEYTDGTLEEELQLEILSATLSGPEDERWVPRGYSRRTVSLTCNPAWLAIEEQVYTDAANTDSIAEVVLDDLRGNLPGPGRIVLEDNSTKARRFVEIGGEWRNHGHGGDLEYTASDFEPAEATFDTDRLELTPVIPAWRTMGYLRDLPHKGAFRARARVRFVASSDAEPKVRLAYRPAGGNWVINDPVVVRTFTPADYAEVDVGSVLSFDDSVEMDVRIDGYGSAVDSSNNLDLNRLSLLPSELYAVARGVPVTSPPAGLVAFDDFADGPAANVALDPRTAPLGGNWNESGDVTPQWEGSFDEGTVSRNTSGDASLSDGGLCLLGAALTDMTVASYLKLDSVTVNGANGICAIVLRYVDDNNLALATLRAHKVGWKVYRYAELRKIVAGSPTVLAQVVLAATPLQSLSTGLLGNLAATIRSDGSWMLKAGAPNEDLSTPVEVASGTDAVFSGTLASGQSGIYHAATGGTSAGYVYAFAAHDEAAAVENVDVVRSTGLGELNSTKAFSAAADASAPAAVSVYDGRRIMLNPGDGRLGIKVRRGDSDAEADTGIGDSTDITVHHRPAFATLSDALS